jgi:hypothetical protein
LRIVDQFSFAQLEWLKLPSSSFYSWQHEAGTDICGSPTINIPHLVSGVHAAIVYR